MSVPTNREGGGTGWHVILADLALILFLVTLIVLPADKAASGMQPTAETAPVPEIAAAQALYRPVAGGPGLAAWLAAQPRDPRATLTVFARYRPGGERQAWAAAAAMVAEAKASGVTVRTIITAGETQDVYASLAYDAVIAPRAR